MTNIPHTPSLKGAGLPILFFSNAATKKAIAEDETAVVASKKARVIAVRMGVRFDVETAQGLVGGRAGDWLVTNHPDDDPGSDVWVVSQERFAETYEIKR